MRGFDAPTVLTIVYLGKLEDYLFEIIVAGGKTTVLTGIL